MLGPISFGCSAGPVSETMEGGSGWHGLRGGRVTWYEGEGDGKNGMRGRGKDDMV